MSYATFAPCPHCNAPLAFLEGASGGTMTPACPRCHEVVAVERATLLMADHSRPRVQAKAAPSGGAPRG